MKMKAIACYWIKILTLETDFPSKPRNWKLISPFQYRVWFAWERTIRIPVWNIMKSFCFLIGFCLVLVFQWVGRVKLGLIGLFIQICPNQWWATFLAFWIIVTSNIIKYYIYNIIFHCILLLVIQNASLLRSIVHDTLAVFVIALWLWLIQYFFWLNSIET